VVSPRDFHLLARGGKEGALSFNRLTREEGKGDRERRSFSYPEKRGRRGGRDFPYFYFYKGGRKRKVVPSGAVSLA